MRKVKFGMFGRIVLAILGGIMLGFLLVRLGAGGVFGLRLLKTFNIVFAQALKFIVPLLILGLVTPVTGDGAIALVCERVFGRTSRRVGCKTI